MIENAMVRRKRRNPARYLAPLALAASIAGTYLIVHSTLGAKSSSSQQTGTISQRTRAAKSRARTAAKKFYTVQSGDSLSAISVKTGVSVATLESLNPNVDPAALQAGQLLRLRR